MEYTVSDSRSRRRPLGLERTKSAATLFVALAAAVLGIALPGEAAERALETQPSPVVVRCLLDPPPVGRIGCRSGILVEIGYSAVLRTPEWAYIENETSEVELYDMRADPFQIESLHRVADPALLDDLHERLRALRRWPDQRTG